MKRDISSLNSKHFDVLIIGAGIAGVCVALDCSQRGLSVALVERKDFCTATSWNSLKILHGGIRYLQHFDIPRLRKSYCERSAFLRIAPHLSRVVPMLMPTYGHMMKGKEIFIIALSILRFLTVDKIGILENSPHKIPFGGLLSNKNVRERLPFIKKENLTGAGVFYDGQIVNPFRLILSILRSAVELGATVANYCEITDLKVDGNKIIQVKAIDHLTNESFKISSDIVVNATGPFSNQLVKQLIPSYKGFNLPLSRDMAFLINKQFDKKYALALQTCYGDPDALLSRGSRHIFIVPWRDLTLVGVSSKLYKYNPYDLYVTEQEIVDFLTEINTSFEGDHISRENIIEVYAGLLPCEGQESQSGNVSYGKRSLIIDHNEDIGIKNLITTATVRLTMGRAVAEKTTDKVFLKLKKLSPACRTHLEPIWGGGFSDFNEIRERISNKLIEIGCNININRWVSLYGSEFNEVLNLVKQNQEFKEKILNSEILKCEVIHAIRNEMAVSLNDYIVRRSDINETSKLDKNFLDNCSRIFAQELGWNEERRRSEISRTQNNAPDNLNFTIHTSGN